MSNRHRSAFSLIETVALVLVAGASGTALMVAQPRSQTRESAARLKDATNIRSIGQGFVVWASSNKGKYPLPSDLDKGDFSVAEKGRAKDTSANIISLLIFNGMISPETCVSPLENNKSIASHDKYDVAKPAKALIPDKALWDPAFNADFSGGKQAHLSYAHQQPAGSRMAQWVDTLNAEEAIFCSRGPEMSGVTVHDEFTAAPTFAHAASNTFKVYNHFGTPGMWSGNVAFNDNHIDFIKDHYAPGKKTETGKQYLDKADKRLPDMAFFDEQDDPKSVNNFLGIFIKAGDTPAAFKAIWD